MTQSKPPRLSWRALQSLLRAGSNPRAVLGQRIGGALREQLIVHVSAFNECVVCAAAHTVMGRIAGASPETLARARRHQLPDGDRARAALRYAEVRTQGREDEVPDVVRELDAHFDADEQREIRAIVDAFTFANRFNNTWESRLPGAELRRRWLGMSETPHAESDPDDE